MKKICFLFVVLSVFVSKAQTNNVVDWINSNAIVIEDSNPNNTPIEFDKKAPQKFTNARIYGFGEASHHNKEFFDIKAKFFKYLVEKQGVRVFMMEEHYQAEKGINEWINGGKGSRLTVVENFTIAPWYCNEVVDLLEWIRNYNQDKPKEEQIRFYGIDTQIGENLNKEIRDFISKYNIVIDDDLLKAVDECAEKQFTINVDKKWADNQLAKLQEVEKILTEHQEKEDYTTILRTLNYLKRYIIYLQNTKTEVRDKQMFKNAVWIMDNMEQNEKVFIWAHNEHISKDGHSGGITNLGKLLKQKYNDNYYSVGFDFGSGILPGVILKKGKVKGWEYHSLEKPYKNTFAETLNKANSEVFFIDMESAINTKSSNFFSKKNKVIGLGASGFNPKKPIFMKRSFTEAYDALIFVKRVNNPKYTITE